MSLGETVFEVLRIGMVVATLVVMGWLCLKMRRTPYSTPYWIGAGIYAFAYARLFRSRRPTPNEGRPEDDGGDAAVSALVGAGPRGPRSAADAKARPEV